MEFPEHMAHSMLQTIYSIPSIHSIHSRGSPHPVHCAMYFASQRECAMFFGERTAHGARGETLLFPPCTPFSPVCCIEACGTQCGGCGTLPCGRLSGLRPLEPPASALLRRDKPGTETKWRCRNMPAGATRPLRARHRRASPRVLEFAQGSSARSIGIACHHF